VLNFVFKTISYLVLIRSLYQSAPISEGDEMMTWMRSSGFRDKLDKKAYYVFIIFYVVLIHCSGRQLHMVYL
jgi:hypothetical protein